MKSLFALAISLISLILIFRLSRELLRLSKANDRLTQAQKTVEQLKLKQWQLQNQKDYYQSKDFVEGQIRDKLMMGKPGETMIVLPKDQLEKEASLSSQSQTVSKEPTWKQWLALFR